MACDKQTSHPLISGLVQRSVTAEQALKLVGEMFVYHMPFNRALGMELERYEKEFAQLAFKNQPMMVGNWAQSILHGGVIASALDVAAGLVCVGSTLTRHETISEDELRQRLSRMGTIDLRVDYLRPGLSLIHISEPTRRTERSRMPSSA